MGNFKIYAEGSDKYIESLTYPRFRGKITFSGKLSDIENIEFFDQNVSVMEAARVMREAGEYIIKNSK
ncbi:hypothetical protein SDC9_20201 [bioreactor metagenome]|uniref:Uncharacterized protein n=1 Tax=bioreactor metagenome TaxID=1076179 RepID=A0A644U619_9ZZZZ